MLVYSTRVYLCLRQSRQWQSLKIFIFSLHLPYSRIRLPGGAHLLMYFGEGYLSDIFIIYVINLICIMYKQAKSIFFMISMYLGLTNRSSVVQGQVAYGS